MWVHSTTGTSMSEVCSTLYSRSVRLVLRELSWPELMRRGSRQANLKGSVIGISPSFSEQNIRYLLILSAHVGQRGRVKKGVGLQPLLPQDQSLLKAINTSSIS